MPCLDSLRSLTVEYRTNFDGYTLKQPLSLIAVFFALSADAVCTKENFIEEATHMFSPASEEEAELYYYVHSDWAAPYDQYTMADNHAFYHACKSKCDTRLVGSIDLAIYHIQECR